MKNNNIKTPVSIQIEKLHPFVGHPYKVLDNEEMNNLITSIQEHGVLSPLIVRPLENTTDQYEIISGHRRLHAVHKAGILEVPALIYAMDRDAAAIAVVDSNLHRENILPSEKAFAYKLKLEALKHQGKTSPQFAEKLTVDSVGASDGISGDTVGRYIRLTNLTNKLLQLVDDRKIAISPAVALSHLTDQEQNDLLETIQSEDCTPSLSQAQQMKKLSGEQRLDIDTIFGILTAKKPNQKEQIRFPYERLKQYFPNNYTPQQIEKSILKLLEDRKRNKERNDAR